MASVRHFTCVSCPIGCDLDVAVDDEGAVASVAGNTCKRGITYAIDEVTDPKRVLTSLVRVDGRTMPASVRSASAVPKALIPDCIEALRSVDIMPPVRIGDVILANVCGTGVDVIATRNMD